MAARFKTASLCHEMPIANHLITENLCELKRHAGSINHSNEAIEHFYVPLDMQLQIPHNLKLERLKKG